MSDAARPNLPGRLGTPDLELRDDPRADPRMVAAMAPFELDRFPPPVPVDARAGSGEPDDARAGSLAVGSLEAGAAGFLVKASAVEELLEAIERVRSGDIYVTPSISQRVLDHLRRPRTEREGVSALSNREFEVLRTLATGMGIKEAARTLKISVSTASTYRARLMKKLGLESTAELIRFALENRLIE